MLNHYYYEYRPNNSINFHHFSSSYVYLGEFLTTTIYSKISYKTDEINRINLPPHNPTSTKMNE